MKRLIFKILTLSLIFVSSVNASTFENNMWKTLYHKKECNWLISDLTKIIQLKEVNKMPELEVEMLFPGRLTWVKRIYSKKVDYGDLTKIYRTSCGYQPNN